MGLGWGRRGRWLVRLLALVALFFAAACRPEPADVDYASHADLRERAEGPESLPGPDPFDPATPRWSVGAFYEGPATTSVPIDGSSAFYFVFDVAGDGSGPLTYTRETSSDRVEGTSSDRIIHAGEGFVGGGIFWYVARDIGALETLHVSLKSSDGAFATVGINVQSGPDRPADGEDPAATHRVTANAYGYANDGEWHNLTIPLADLEAMGFDSTQCRSPFFFDAGGGMSGESLLIDNLYLE